MDNNCRLVFRGELRDGQHPAVVKKRLAEALKLNEEQTAKLFAGKPVVVKREADEATAARYVALFAKAGAVLRVLETSSEEGAERGAPPPESPRTSAFSVLPVGSELLRSDERTVQRSVNVDTDHLSLAAPGVLSQRGGEAEALELDLSHISLAETGAMLGEARKGSAVQAPDVHFEIAEPGTRLSEPRTESAVAPDTSSLTLAD